MGKKTEVVPLTSLGNKEVMSRNLKYYIERSGKDRRELAEIWGFPYSTVTDWINAKKYPRIDRIEVMADYFGIKKSDLIEDRTRQTRAFNDLVSDAEARQKKEPAENDGLPESVQKLIEFAKTVPEDQAEMMLQTLKVLAAQADKMKEALKADR